LFLAMAFAVFVAPGLAGTCSDDSTEAPSCAITFTAGDTTGTYEFFGNGRLVVQFDTVLTPSPGFTLTVTVVNTLTHILDPKEFPDGTVCVKYSGNGGQCAQYDFTGSSSGPNGVPVKNKDYKGLITLTLSYINLSSQTIRNPAFGHAPGDSATAVYSEDFLAVYSSEPSGDPTMGGKIPGLSSVAALDEPLTETDNFCGFESAPVEGNSLQEGEEIEFAFRLAAGASGSCTPPSGIRDKTAVFSVWIRDTNGDIVFQAIQVKEEGNKFHWDSKNGLNELDLSTVGLAPRQYHLTVRSLKFSPKDMTFTVGP
jgi:hypothetical protein